MNSCKKAFLPFPAVNNFSAQNLVFQKDLMWFLADWGEDWWGMFRVTNGGNFFNGKNPKTLRQTSLLSPKFLFLLLRVCKCIKQPYLDWEVWKLECRTGNVRAVKVSVWDFSLRLDRGDLCAWVGVMAKSRYHSGLTLPCGRKVCLLPNSGCWLLQKRDESVFLAPKPKGDLSQLNYTCPLGRLLRPKPLKTSDSFI